MAFGKIGRAGSVLVAGRLLPLSLGVMCRVIVAVMVVVGILE